MNRLRPLHFFAPAAFGAAWLCAVPVAVSAQEVVQQLPDPAQGELSDALRRLTRNPESVPALVDAGRAALQLGDISASLGYFNRAQRIDPNDGRVLLGLAIIATRRGEAVKAIQLFDNANAAGVSLNAYSADRGLAYDLVGNNGRAQRLYRQALSRDASDEVIRRLALSYAISGDGAASEATLLPLLQRQDRAAFRTRAFALAIMGRAEEANTISETMLPPRLSNRLAPYFNYMPRLTRAQQAMAANLGRFPSASDIGRDSTQVAALAETPAAAQAQAGTSDRLTPAGEPLGRAEPASTPSSTGELPALAQNTASERVRAAEPVVQPVPEPPAREPEPVVAVELAQAAELPPAEEARPSFSLTEPVASGEPAEAAPTTAQQLGLEEAFADFTLESAALPTRPSAGAVDITAIEPARPAPEPAPEPAPPAHPSRHWVQVATGQDTSAFRFDWRRIVRNADGLLDGREAFTAPWGQSNRLVTGPFDSAGAANRFVTELGEKGVDAFRFTSAAGEEVRPID